MILLDRLTQTDGRLPELFENARPLKVHKDVIALASHLATDPDKLQKAAGHIFWPDYESWIEWEDDQGYIAFYFDGAKAESVTEGRGAWVMWRRTDDEPLVVSLTYNMPRYQIGLLNPMDEVQRSVQDLSEMDRRRLMAEARQMLSRNPIDANQFTLRAAAETLRPVIYAVLALINSPKLIRRHHVSQERINRARLKRGKYPFHPHHEVKLDVDKSIITAMTGSQGDGSHKALHFVRSHLRFRLGQYELVRPHWRGDPEVGIIDTEYAAGRAKSKWKDA